MDDILYRQMAAIQNRHWWYCARRAILDTMLSRLPLKPDARILEVGCGTGVNLGMLQKHGIVHGLEPYDFARKTAADLTGCDIRGGTLPADIPFDRPFDVICAFDVIEHIDEDAASLNALYQHLSPNGYALFTVPAYPFLWSEHDVANHHKRRYTRPQFKALMEQAGFEIHFISYYNTLLFPLIAAIRLLKSILPPSSQQAVADLKMPRFPALNTALEKIFALERKILPHISLPFGVSIIAIGRKISA